MLCQTLPVDSAPAPIGISCQTPGVTMDRLLSLAAGTILDVAPHEASHVAAAAGWPAVGIWFDAATWTHKTSVSVSAALRDTGVVALDMEPVIFSPDGDPGEALIDAAADIGARHVLVASRLPVSPAVVERFGALCDRAAAAHITLVLEFLPIFAIRSLAEALSVVNDAGRANAGVLVDTLHLARSGGTPADLAVIDPARLPYLQLADAPAVPPDATLRGLLYEAIDARLLPGDGELPLVDVLRMVPHVPVSVELRSAALRTTYVDPVERARVVLAATNAVVDQS